MEIRGRTAVVTGGASGLGLAVARMLDDQGARVALLDQDPERIRASLANTSWLGFDVDVSDELATEHAFSSIRDSLGPVSILVNCAGIATPGSVVRKGVPMPLDEFRRVIEVNLLGTINCIRLAVAQMVQGNVSDPHDCGVIVNTASIAAFDGQVGQAAYAASKAGVAAITLPIARELGANRIRIMAIAPGVFATPMTLDLPEKSRNVVFSAKPPHPARAGQPEEFADLVLSILRNPMLNGEVIRLDGGLRMPARY